jgi:hypothetical protein
MTISIEIRAPIRSPMPGTNPDQQIETDGPAANQYHVVHQVGEVPDPRIGRGQAFIGAVDIAGSIGCGQAIFLFWHVRIQGDVPQGVSVAFTE